MKSLRAILPHFPLTEKSENRPDIIFYMENHTLKISAQSEHIDSTSFGKGVAVLANWLLSI